MTKSINVEVIFDRMIDYMISLSDDHYKIYIASRCVEFAEQFAPSNHWFIQTMNKVFEHAGVTQSEHKFIAHGMPTEATLKVLVEKMDFPEGSNNLHSTSTLLRSCEWWNKHDRRIATLEFDRDRKSMGVIVDSGLGKNSLLVKGAVENVLDRRSKIQLRDGSVVKLDDNARNLVLQALHEMSTRVLRCL